MKTMTRLLAILLAGLTVLCLLPAAFAAGTELIDRAGATVSAPIIGKTVADMQVTSAEPDKYTAELVGVYYWNGLSYTLMTAENVFEEEVAYSVRVQFTAAEGYRFDDSKTVYLINEAETDGKVGAHTCELAMVAEEDTTQTTEKPGLFRRIFSAIRGFFADVRDFFRSLFKKK